MVTLLAKQRKVLDKAKEERPDIKAVTHLTYEEFAEIKSVNDTPFIFKLVYDYLAV